MQAIMGTTPEFYRNGYGDRFIDPSLFNEEVAAFLCAEEQILNTLSCAIHGLVEVGCMHGRYLEWAILNRKRYFGLDMVERYIIKGRKSVHKRGLSSVDYRFILGSMEQLPAIVDDPDVSAHPDKYVMLFPFNSFGNMDHPEGVIQSMQSLKLHFVVSSYQVTAHATNARTDYYAKCGYQNLQVMADPHKVVVTSAEGLRSYAFNPTYLMRQFGRHGISVLLMPFANIGMACLSAGLGDLLSHYEVAPTLYPRAIADGAARPADTWLQGVKQVSNGSALVMGAAR